MKKRKTKALASDGGPSFIKPWIWELHLRTVVGGRWRVTLAAYGQDGQGVECHREWEGAAGNTAQRDKDLVLALAMFDKMQEIPPLLRPLALLGEADKKALEEETGRVIKDVDDQLGRRAREDEAALRQPEEIGPGIVRDPKPTGPCPNIPGQDGRDRFVWVQRKNGTRYKRRQRRFFRAPAEART